MIPDGGGFPGRENARNRSYCDKMLSMFACLA